MGNPEMTSRPTIGAPAQQADLADEAGAPPIRGPRARRRDWRPLLSLASLAVLVGLWYLLTDVMKAIDPLYFPSVHETISAAGTLGWNLTDDAQSTAWRVLLSWLIGCSLGVLVGLIMARSRIAYFLVNPLVEALRPIPPIALIPFTLIWFGLTEQGRIVLAALSCFMIMVVSTVGAARNVPPVYLRAAASLGASRNRVYGSVVFRAIVPTLVSALRVSAGLAWAVVVAAEYLGAQNGIGFLILQASHTVNTPVVLLGTIVVGLEAFIFEQLIKFVTNYATRWVDRSGH